MVDGAKENEASENLNDVGRNLWSACGTLARLALPGLP